METHLCRQAFHCCGKYFIRYKLVNIDRTKYANQSQNERKTKDRTKDSSIIKLVARETATQLQRWAPPLFEATTDALCANGLACGHSQNIISYIIMLRCIVWLATGKYFQFHLLPLKKLSAQRRSPASSANTPMSHRYIYCWDLSGSCSQTKLMAVGICWGNNMVMASSLDFFIIIRSALSVNVLSPKLASQLIPKRDVTNFMLIHSVIGTTLYIYSRSHLQSVEPKKRVAYRWEWWKTIHEMDGNTPWFFSTFAASSAVLCSI